VQARFATSPFDSRNFHHTGIVVGDIDRAIEHLESLGIGPFVMRGGQKWIDIPFKGELHGRPAEWSVKISNATVGEHELELLQPSGGESVLQEFLDERGEGVHHIAYLVDDVKGEVQRLADQGMEILTSANLDTRGFAYIRTSAGGVVIEIRFR
jgi:catechol 2,3-dioxygenase-like lactoylglutathione lyase family enzyme